MSNIVSEPCQGCKGAFRCWNEYSPCYLYHCGEYPGTGPSDPDTEEADQE